MLIEDDPTVRSVVGEYLRVKGFDVQEHSDGARACMAARDELPDLMIVDRMLPGLSGDEVCRDIRTYSDVPIIMLTALSSIDERIEGLEQGADDYLGKPFSLRELHLRVQALLRRRTAVSSQAVIAVDSFRVDLTRRRVWEKGREITLTTREFELFVYLLRNVGRVISREELLREVWGWGFGDASTVTVHVRRLREKIEQDPRFPSHLVTVWGAGYQFSAKTVSR